ncbi:MAG: 3',5'-cyclic-nucleotide phosphodiesterase [Proteobacteria bacterium]|nr:3',5'-cyclic-nucleotide phosphodiesterase [Pseudomonadota bacterium]MBS0608818.1 3',5'-cyclic-nucleotide phosphodiesterase [Pseudomonadota bacterium]
MKIRILGCSGSIARGCRTTSFLLGEHILVDAGTGVGELTLDEMRRVDHVFLTHSHLDHIAALPLLLDAVGACRPRPLQVHALPATLAALRAHVFNDVIWPDFTRIPTRQAPFVRLLPLGVGDVFGVAGISLEVLPARHSVPAVGYAARGQKGWWVYSGDTEGLEPAFWRRVNALCQSADGVSALCIETAFSNAEAELARISRHLSPTALARELTALPAGIDLPIYITHAKPQQSSLIMREVQALDHGALRLIDLQTVDVLSV